MPPYNILFENRNDSYHLKCRLGQSSFRIYILMLFPSGRISFIPRISRMPTSPRHPANFFCPARFIMEWERNRVILAKTNFGVRYIFRCFAYCPAWRDRPPNYADFINLKIILSSRRTYSEFVVWRFILSEWNGISLHKIYFIV